MPAEPFLHSIRVGFLSSDVEDKLRAHRTLVRLHDRDHRAFIEACQRLIQDVEIGVARPVLPILAQFGDRDDASTEALVMDLVGVPELKRAALHALGTVGTDAAVQLLFSEAESDPGKGLPPLARQVRSMDDMQRALAMARKALLSPLYRNRDAALRALHTLSTAEAEEDLLLTAYRMYHDELVAWALGAASPCVLPALHELADSIDSRYVQHAEILAAIRRLQTRMEHGEAADLGRRNFFLRDYL